MLVTELEKAKTEFKIYAKKQEYGKSVNLGDDIIIDTENVIYIENGSNYYTYTFNIKREGAPENAPLENLVLSPLTDGTYKEFIVSYNLTPQEKQIIMSGGFLDTKDKSTITELGTGVYPGLLSKDQNCYWEPITIDIPCASPDDLHMPGQACNLTGANGPQKMTVFVFICKGGDPVGGGWEYGGSGSNGNGGGASGNEDPYEGNYNEAPCSPNGVLTGPQIPNDNTGTGLCGGGVPTLPNLPDPEEDPCEKTKALLEDSALTEKVGTLKEQSKIKGDNSGEKGFNVNLDGTTGGIITGEKHSVHLGDEAGKQGGYHNHTPDGIKMHSPPDILKMLNYSLAQPNGNISNGFLGMVGSEECSTCPDGYKYHNYIIRFSGNSQELVKFIFDTNWDEDALDKDYEDREDLMRDNPLYVDEYGRLNNNGLQKLFFETLKNMKMEGKVTLQKIEDNGSVQNIVLDNAGNPSPIPCP